MVDFGFNVEATKEQYETFLWQLSTPLNMLVTYGKHEGSHLIETVFANEENAPLVLKAIRIVCPPDRVNRISFFSQVETRHSVIW